MLLTGGLLFTAGEIHSQTLTGIVTDEKQMPLAGVQIRIPALHRGAITDAHGQFSIPALPNGRHIIQFHLIGYKDENIVLELAERDTSLAVEMTASPLEGATVTVTARPQAADLLSTPQSAVSFHFGETEFISIWQGAISPTGHIAIT